MLSLHFNKEIFINALKANKNMVTYLSTTAALLVTLIIHGLIQGNLKPEFFIYAFIVSVAFYVWAIVDQKYRYQKQNTSTE
ncbi:hypothetical protein GCM10023345_15670 [Acinetobacter kookii]|uniref:Uncharacterized protein n=1 Tax=Acinetobacter kookii TaxID=1226327 RepID=A0A1G6GNL5_9GAMM|nr:MULTISPECIES: hypothetical protein [Acinetobacter]MCT8088330.1 hypothetical protein [Acinetobacter sp. F_3_1]MCT8097699.1 hypothetical protein [Acinetobacter sp. C_3_1]MCT8100355.1 hypothetical protein [Acinetobacter sp. C_4_1]MCT8133926.1 hypothetical protein [Acinetobacter sp. T_3_1]TCB67362.1 hypothetical protein E0H88_12595 [Acinetobacter sp. ANC 4216]